MSGLAVLLLAAPTFGLALHAPSAAPLLDLSVNMPALLAAADPDDDQASETTDGDASDGDSTATASDDAQDKGEAKKADSSAEDDYNAQIKRRNSLIKIHRPLGIATWVAMTAALTLGTIQYYNLYGFGSDIGHNPCVQGNAIFGQDQCSGTPLPHLIAAGVTTALYTATFTISLMMPDPDDLASGKGEFASTLRLHKLLRWIHFGGMVAQVVLGIIIANDVFDRANDYDTLQILATAHLASGVITYGALTWAGALMTF
jgi:hypothetical protein